MPWPEQSNFLYLFRGDASSVWFTQDVNWDWLTGDLLYISETRHNILQQSNYVFKSIAQSFQNNAIPSGRPLSPPVLELAAAQLSVIQ